MSTSQPEPLPESLQQTLDLLRRKIRRYVLIEGACLVVVVLAGLFWLSFFADVIYFRLSRLELPGWFRSTFFIAMLCALVAAVLVWVIARLLRRLRHRALALVLERRFPALDDRVISAVELTEEPPAGSTPLTRAMVERTIRAADDAVRRLDLTDVFNHRPLRRALVAASLLVASIVGLSVANGAAVKRWYSAYVRGEDRYWDPFRRSALNLRVVAQPGDRVRDFDSTQTYRHPRGADLTLRVEVAEGKEVPEQVVLEYRTVDGGASSRGRVTMSRQGDQSFQHTLARVIGPHDLWVTGGDYTNREAYHVEIVDAPRIDHAELTCDYPDYTGMDAFADQTVPVQGAQVSLPMETSFLLTATANKPLRGMTLRSPAFDLRIRGAQSGASVASSEATLTIKNGAAAEGAEPITVTVDEPDGGFLSADGTVVTIPFVISSSASAALLQARDQLALPIPLPPDTPVQIELYDADDIQSLESLRLTIGGIVDLPPVVETRLRGVGRSITRLASIPIEGEIRDDYGVADAHFSWRIDAADEDTATSMTGSPAGQKLFPLQSPDEAVERFNVRPLELRIGQALQLAVVAEDGDTINGPHVSQGEVYGFTIVSPEALLSLLYDKELNLRQRFEQIIAEVTEARDDLQTHHQLSAQAQGLRTQAAAGDKSVKAQLDEAAAAIVACGERRLHTIRKNHTETRAIEQMFGDIRAELVNNRVDTATMRERIDQGITAPLHQINEIDYPRTDASIALFRLAQERGEDPTDLIEEARRDVDSMLDQMNQVLREMRRRETFNEVVKRLQAILEKQEQLRDRTRKERLRSVIENDF